MARTPDDLYAFWRDGDDNLFVSHVAAAAFGNYDAWTARQQLGSHVAGMAAAVGGDGTIHLAYLQAADVEGAPAGIYVQRLEANAGAWSAPQPCTFRYYRLITADTAISPSPPGITSSCVVYEPQVSGWPVRPTADSWEDFAGADRRRPTTARPLAASAVRLVAAGDELHLSWQAGHEGSVRAQYHQWSQDGGATWRPPSGGERGARSGGGRYRTSTALRMATSSICSAARRTTPTSTWNNGL